MKKLTKPIHICQCAECQQQPTSGSAKLHESINRVLAQLNEKNRRLFVGLLALQLGYGGLQHISSITGMSRVTIRRGRSELASGECSSGGPLRGAGGGRKCVEKKSLRS